MEYSVDFKNMVKAHQGKFIGYGNPNANILIIVPKMDDERLDVYNENNSKQWLANIENQTDFDDVVDFFADEGQVGNGFSMTFVAENQPYNKITVQLSVKEKRE